MELIYESPTPEHCSIGNLIQEKRYEEAIRLGVRLLDEGYKDKAMVYMNLMVAYTKIKDNDNALKCAKLAILSGHLTGMAFERAAILFEKSNKYGAAIEICQMVLNPNFYFSLYAGNDERKKEFMHRLERLQKRNDKANDTSCFLTPKQQENIIKKSFKEYVKQVRERNKHIEKYKWDCVKNSIPEWV